MSDDTETTDRQHRFETALAERFDASSEDIESVAANIEKARQIDELSDLHWDDPEGVAEGIKNFAQGQGLQAGWNRWIQIQEIDGSRTAHLKIGD